MLRLIPVATLALGVAMIFAISAVANWQFALSFGLLLAFVSLSFDLVKVGLLASIPILWRSGHYIFCIILSGAFMVCSGWSIRCGLGYAGSLFDVTSTRVDRQAAVGGEKFATYERLRQERALLGNVGQEGVLQSRIEEILLDPLTEGCAKLNGPVTAQKCPEVFQLRGEIARSRAATRLDVQISSLGAELSKAEIATNKDVALDLLSFAGLRKGQTHNIFAAAIILAMEFISMIGISALSRILETVGLKKSEPAPEPKRRKTKAEPQEKKKKPKLQSVPIHQGNVIEFLQNCCILAKKGHTSTPDLFNHYKSWCDSCNYIPVSRPSFGTKLAAYAKREGVAIRQSGRVKHYGLNLRNIKTKKVA